MSRVVLLQVDSATAAGLSDALLPLGGVELVTAPDLAAALVLLEREPGAVDAVVIGSWQREPVAAAQRVRPLVPRALLLVLAEPARAREIEGALQREIVRGESIRCLPVQPAAGVVAAVTEAVVAGRRRLAHEAQVAAANEALQKAPLPRPARSLGRLLDDAPVGVLLADAEGRILASNRLGHGLLGRDGRLVGESFPALLPEPARAAWLAALERDHSARVRLLLELAPPGAPARMLELTASRTDDSHGPAERLIFLSDVTERIAAERERQVLLDQLQRTGHFREQFIGVLAHDLRSPLQAISMTAQLLLKDAAEKPGRLRSLARITSSADRMNRMISDVLDFTRTRLGGGLPLHPVRVDLAALCRQLLEEFDAAAPDRRIRLGTAGDIRGHWDPDRLHQLLGNLLGNAVRYGPAEGEIRLEARAAGAGVELSVQNGGAPIPAELLPRIFEPFERATQETRSGGLGLGLYIVNEIALAHGGSVSVTSTADAGTCFTVLLPREAPRVAG